MSGAVSPERPYGELITTTLRVMTWNVWGRFGPWQERETALIRTLETLAPRRRRAPGMLARPERPGSGGPPRSRARLPLGVRRWHLPGRGLGHRLRAPVALADRAPRAPRVSLIRAGALGRLGPVRPHRRAARRAPGILGGARLAAPRQRGEAGVGPPSGRLRERGCGPGVPDRHRRRLHLCHPGRKDPTLTEARNLGGALHHIENCGAFITSRTSTG